MAVKPTSVGVRMYQVGFGDCFLLSFGYPDRSERHMLIDFGTTSRPRGSATPLKIAESIEQRTGGRLDVLVITHRHRDHLSGLGSEKSAAVIKRLAPKLVVLPWTEDPAAAHDAGIPHQALLNALAAGGQYAATVDKAAPTKGTGSQSELAKRAREQISNADAVAWLGAAAKTAKAEYLHSGEDSSIGDFIPGLEVLVLGPPTPKQWPDVQHQRAEDPEYWMLGQQLLDHYYAPDPTKRLYGQADPELPLPTEYRRTDPAPGPERWIAARLRRQELASMTAIVRWLDDALNNTSLVLLLEAAGRRMLFAGDAQIENWGYALSQVKPKRSRLKRLLTEIDLLKVGHHGSRNATPRSLHKLWTEHQAGSGRKFVAFMSTRAGVHGRTEATRVPRTTLVRALRDVADVYSTDGSDQLFIEATANTGDARFTIIGGRPLTDQTLRVSEEPTALD
jgi:beta-lactamase superfamily II metal-dependent hydrolase